MDSFVEEVDEVFERMVGVVQQQVPLLDVIEYRFPFVQAIQFHGLRLLDRLQIRVRVGQAAEVLQVEVFVARHQFVTVYPVSVYQKFQEIGWHGTIVDEATHSASLSFFDFRLQLFDDFVAACGIVYQDIRVARNLDAIAAVHPIA